MPHPPRAPGTWTRPHPPPAPGTGHAPSTNSTRNVDRPLAPNSTRNMDMPPAPTSARNVDMPHPPTAPGTSTSPHLPTAPGTWTCPHPHNSAGAAWALAARRSGAAGPTAPAPLQPRDTVLSNFIKGHSLPPEAARPVTGGPASVLEVRDSLSLLMGAQGPRGRPVPTSLQPHRPIQQHPSGPGSLMPF